MRIGVDTNVLIYAHISSLADHTAVRRYLTAKLESPDTRLVISPMILHELVHVITDPRRFSPAVEMSEALSVARTYLGRDNVECLSVGESAMTKALELIDRHQLGRRRISDTLFAASLIDAGVETLLTCNERDFAVFDDLTLVDPRRE